MLMMSNNTLKLRKNNKNGFTLIELLAVIVILALIALITTPIILNVVENAKRSAAVDSTYGYIKAIEYNNTMAQASNKYQLITESDAKKINELVTIKGNKATEGIIEYDKNYNVATANICMSEYKVVYKNGEAKANGERCGEKFDFTKPVVQITKVTSTTKEINVDFVATDEESDIDEAICEYGTTKKYGNKGI